MSEFIKRALFSIDALQHLKELRQLNPVTSRMVLGNPQKTAHVLAQAIEVSKLFRSPFNIPSAEVDGFYRFALTEKNDPIGINPHECHCLICGQTSTGKSTLLKVLFGQVLRNDTVGNEKLRCWFFSKSQELRDLLAFEKDLLVVLFNRDKSFKLNPLEPPLGVSKREWASIFVDLWQAFRVWEGTKGFLLDHLIQLYEKYSGDDHYPSLFDLYDYIKSIQTKYSSRIAVYKEGIITRLGALIMGPLGSVFDCSQGHSRYLTDLNIVFETLYLSNEQQIFTINYLLSYLFHYKMVNKTNIRNWIALDDATSVFDALYEHRVDLGLPIIHNLLATVRKNKINIFACTQTPHQVGSSLHSNSFAKIMFSLSNGTDIEHMIKSMGIKDPEQKKYIYTLPPRQAIVKFSGRWQEPFLAKIPEVNL